MDIITKQEARTQGLLLYFTGLPCKRGHISQRNVSKSECLMCKKERDVNYYKNNKEHRLKKQKQYYKDNRQARLDYMVNYQSKNKSAIRKYWEGWYKDNSHIAKHNAILYKLRKCQATPNWLTQTDLDSIKMTYCLCEQLNSTEDEDYHVDHIVPIKGKLVCGLHVPWNLQIITKTENLKKHNKFKV